ncbi:arsenate reductase ArsC [Mollicutes bacterium LVI A0078]|nr:arsenate reductase ArsC [Mollicutes bacterium LVI A0075]WOO90889.1 arsenate reductase ArsC [Mollicutes bacterium LVI A0078]
MEKIKIGFICVHNSCRSIMAEGICREKYGEMFEVYSGGTEENNVVKQDALTTLKSVYNIEGDFSSKLIDTLPELDVVITMGCNVECPHLPSKYREDFGIDDPSHKSLEIFELSAKLIEAKIDLLALKIKTGEIEL